MPVAAACNTKSFAPSSLGVAFAPVDHNLPAVPQDDGQPRPEQDEKPPTNWWGIAAFLAVFFMGIPLIVVGLVVPSEHSQTQLHAAAYFGLALVAGGAIMLAGMFVFQNISIKGSYVSNPSPKCDMLAFLQLLTDTLQLGCVDGIRIMAC
jgi:hypothetical protein